tara:strand:- start:195 stop:1502 length:1308 start_codon:yes stop_codon:yes gene_type:complete
MVHLKKTTTMKQKLTLTVVLTFILTTSFGQTIEIGQDARVTKQIIEYSTSSRTGYDSYGNSKGNNVVYDVKYYSGEISEVIQCFSRQYLIDFRIQADFCKHYIMEGGKLAYVLTQYENVSVSKLKEYYNQSYEDRKAGELYFSEDYKNYSKIYLHSNGLATIEWGETNPNDLPQSIKSEIDRKLKEQEEAERQRQLAEQKRKEREKEIKSKIYDLQEHSQYRYEEVLNRQREAIKKYFANSSSYYSSERFPSFETLAKSDKKYERFKSTYNVHYKLQDNSRESVNYGYVIVAGSRDINTLKKVELVDGTDKDLKLFNSASISLPTIEIEGYEVMTEATLNDVSVDFTRGLTEVKIKGGEVDFKKYSPEQDLQQKISDKLKSEPNGRYLVKYEVADIMGQTDVNTEIEKIPSKAGKIFKTVGGIVLIGGLIVLGAL